jgi:hypothetical protein
MLLGLVKALQQENAHLKTDVTRLRHVHGVCAELEAELTTAHVMIEECGRREDELRGALTMAEAKSEALIMQLEDANTGSRGNARAARRRLHLMKIACSMERQHAQRLQLKSFVRWRLACKLHRQST